MTKRTGNVVVVTPEPDANCSMCGKLDELRPAGPNSERVCWDCAQKDKAALERYTERLFRPQVVTMMPTCKCPTCGHVLDAATGDDGPQPGDLSVCAHCTGLSVVTDQLALRQMTQAEIDLLPPARRQEIMALQQMAHSSPSRKQ